MEVRGSNAVAHPDRLRCAATHARPEGGFGKVSPQSRNGFQRRAVASAGLPASGRHGGGGGDHEADGGGSGGKLEHNSRPMLRVFVLGEAHRRENVT